MEGVELRVEKFAQQCATKFQTLDKNMKNVEARIVVIETRSNIMENEVRRCEGKLEVVARVWSSIRK